MRKRNGWTFVRHAVAVSAALGLLLASGGVLRAADVTFTTKPTATPAGDQVRIAFAVSAPTDVEVAILDAKGAIVRHLAAGVLGANAPAPFKANSLAQELTWNGKADVGQAAQGGPFKVRVALGLKVESAGAAFGSMDKGDDLTNVVGLAAAPDGKLYVLSERWNWAWWQQTTIHVFRRDGSYEKTIKPYPATLAPDRVAGLTSFRDAAGRPLPTIYRINGMNYYPTQDLPQQMAVTPDGNLHLLTLRDSYVNDREQSDRHFASIAPDGGCAYKDYVGTEIPGERAPGDVYLATASDGKSLFATGIERGDGTEGSNRPNLPLVYRVDLPDRKTAATFFGDVKATGSDKMHLNDPRGLATDGKGNLFVADSGNNRVVVFDEKTGKFVRAIAVKQPTWVGLDRRSGAIYVASPGTLVKFVAGDGGALVEKAKIALPVLTGRGDDRAKWSFAVDSSADPVVLWVGLSRGGTALYRCEDQGTQFTTLTKAGYRDARAYWNVATGYDGKTVACKVGNSTLRFFDEDSGDTRDLRPSEGSAGQTYRLGPNNQIYGMDHPHIGIIRWDKDGKKLPFPTPTRDNRQEAKGRLGNVTSGTTNWERDFDVDRLGNVYTKERGPIYHGRMRVDKYDKDGKFLGPLIFVVSDGAHGPRVDAAGNVYVADTVKPVGQSVPSYFKKDQFPPIRVDKRSSAFNQYEWMYGSIMKFGPAGGSIWFPIIREDDVYPPVGDAKLPADQTKVKIESCVGDRMEIKPAELQGAQWYHYGVSYILDMHPGHNRRCHCTATEFDVDDYGRTFYTDQGRFCVVVLDTNGNEILTYGRYGNQDSSAADMGFSWFGGLGASDRYIYAADVSNRRVLRAAMKHAAEEVCAIK